MSNIDVKKSNAVYKRVSFDGDWPEQCEERKNRFRYNKKRTFSEGSPSFRDYRSGQYTNRRVGSDSKLSENESVRSGSSTSVRKSRILSHARSNNELFSGNIETNQKYKNHWNNVTRKILNSDLNNGQRDRNSWEFVQRKIQFVGFVRKVLSRDSLMEGRKQKLAKQKHDAAVVSILC